jgi:hypothetical protein
MPGTPIKTFRLRLFLFAAAEDPYTPEDIAYFSSSRTSRWAAGCMCWGAVGLVTQLQWVVA